MTNGKNSTCDFLREGTLLRLFWGEQQATVALVAVACIFSARHLNDGGGCSGQELPLLERPLSFWGTLPPLAAFGRLTARVSLSIFLP
jgi:hypothetical protein